MHIRTHIHNTSVASAKLRSIFLHFFADRSVAGLGWGAKSRNELGPPYSSLTRYHLCYAARTLAELRHTLTAPQLTKLHSAFQAQRHKNNYNAPIHVILRWTLTHKQNLLRP
jgi:hypothetical protein